MEQLQQTLNEAIKMGRKPRGCNTTIVDNGLMKFWWISGWGDEGLSSIHDLFSKDSGIMEFMKWKSDKRFIRQGGEYSNGQMWYNGCTRDACIIYHYMMMGPMSATDKINYFNTNAYLPGTKS